jgi:2-polyprenyl-6-methoxyphenol hydroxylase-like FAD-dependent oxidoreductase
MLRLGGHAVVIGGSIAGLMTARVLSDFFDQVTVVERDDLEERPILHKSIPQGNHFHGLLQGGHQILCSFFPGFAEDLRSHGAVQLRMDGDVAWYLPDGKAYNFTGSVREPCALGFEAHSASRGLFEFLIRRRTLGLPNVRFETGIAVRELCCRYGRVHGVRCDGSRSLEADLVVDAGGRGSRATKWLAAIGFRAPGETSIGVDIAYSTAYFQRPRSYAGESLVFIVGPPPDFVKRGYVCMVEDDRLLVSLIGRFVYPPTDDQGFFDFARSLHSPLICQIIQEAERLSPIAHHRVPISLQRHYERLPAFPEGLLILGDAVCCLNPVYGQGMSTAALQASALQQILAEHGAQHGLDKIGAAFFPKMAEINNGPWTLAANLDLAYPQTRGERPPGFGERARYMAALDRLQVDDIELQRLVMAVFHLTRPLSALHEEPLRSRVLARMHS